MSLAMQEVNEEIEVNKNAGGLWCRKEYNTFEHLQAKKQLIFDNQNQWPQAMFTEDEDEVFQMAQAMKNHEVSMVLQMQKKTKERK